MVHDADHKPEALNGFTYQGESNEDELVMRLNLEYDVKEQIVSRTASQLGLQP